MKTIIVVILLVISLVANVVMLAKKLQATPVVPATAAMVPSGKGPAPKVLPAVGPVTAKTGSDLPGLLARLRSAGVPEAMIRVWLTAEIEEQYHDREQALLPPPKAKYWQVDPVPSLANQLAMAEIALEKARLVEDLLGPDLNGSENAPYGFLPDDKRLAVKRVAEEFDGKLAIYRAATAGMATPEEEAEIARLETARRAALGALLSDADLHRLDAQLALGRWEPPEPNVMGYVPPALNEPVTARLRKSLRYFDATEQEFLVINAIEEDLEYTRKYGHMDSGALATAEETRVRDALGAERFAEYQRKTTSEYGDVAGVVQRLGLAPAVADEIAGLQGRVLAVSTKLNADTSSNVEAKRAELRTFTQNERKRISSLVGLGGTTALNGFLRGWLEPLEEGNLMVPLNRGAIEIFPIERTVAPMPR